MPDVLQKNPENTAAAPAAAAPEKARSLWGDAVATLLRSPVFLISGLLILLLLTVAFWPGLFTSMSPYDCDLAHSRQGSAPGHPFGFDVQGCDVYARTLYGAKASVEVGVFVTAGVFLLGGLLGMLAGFFGGWWDSLLSRITDIFFGIPIVLGGLVILSVIKANTVWPVIGFMIAFGWPPIARVARGSVITVKQQDFVQAAKALGAGNGRIMLRHIVPNAVAPVIVVSTIALGTYISLEATLSFLGVGLQPPTVSWGQDISTAAAQYRNAPHMLLWPAGALSLTVLSFIMLGEAVRGALDPKQR
ncbi:Glutathione transport system permease protein GsiD [Streptomyces sp. RB5]|uniref:Glutathione transport system permease protein GsiD n=1 Tax=Streptomyces smaragdinus TaxID=2585196 RepID=A0A7K0CJA3_9ACTN|nr:ABC transporter permease [Streptomyces smaragdinus]MQY13565.1 Glutathione transport system permease protein GsiD [Streptomyces smaragdinus]